MAPQWPPNVDEMPETARRHLKKKRQWEANRRRFLQLGGAGIAAALAGCFGDDDGSDGDGGDGDGGDGGDGDGGDGGDGDGGDGGDGDDTTDPEELEDVERTYNGITYHNPGDINFNSWDWDNFPYGDAIEVVFARPAYAHPTERGEYIYNLLEEVEVEPNELRFTFRDDAEWSNGEPITGEAMYVKDNLEFTYWGAHPDDIEDPGHIWNAITGMDWEGQTTIYKTKNGWFENRYGFDDYMEFMTGEPYFHRYPGQNREYLDRMLELDDPRSDEAWGQKEEIMSELFEQEYREPDEVIASGPFQLENITDSEVVFTPNEGYPHADKINWNELRLRHSPDANAVWAGLESESLDAAHTVETPVATVESFPDHVHQALIDQGISQGLIINHQDDVIGGPENTRVRHALMHMIDREQIAATVHEFTHQPVHTPTGFTRVDDRNWIGDDLLESFNRFEFDRDRAAEILEAEGFTQEGGTWTTPDGEPLSIQVMTDNESPVFEPLITDQLEAAGVQTELMPQDGATHEDNLTNGDYQTATWRQGDPHIWEANAKFLDEINRWGWWDSQTVQEEAEADSNAAWQDSAVENESTDFYARDAFAVEAPPVGEWDGELQEYYPGAIGHGLFAETGEERQRAWQELAWVWNWQQPMLQITEIMDQSFQNRQDWITPATDDVAWQIAWPQWFMLQTGQLHADPDA